MDSWEMLLVIHNKHRSPSNHRLELKDRVINPSLKNIKLTLIWIEFVEPHVGSSLCDLNIV